ncbi:TPA: Mitochondrial ATPase complex subunit atp10, variant 2 [Trebouxia sp. C0004]
MQHGYFDDFRAVRDQHGKIFSSPERLIDAQAAQPFPPTQMLRPDGVQCTIPPPPGQHQAALLCTAFRAGAEDILASWSTPFKERYGSQQGTHYFELSFVESAVMSVWPFKQIILRAQLGKAPIPSPTQATSSPAAHASRAGSSTPGQSLAASSSPQVPPMPPQQLMQQKKQAQLGKESASQPGTEISHEASQQQQAMPSSAAQPGAECNLSEQQEQQQQQQQSLVEGSTDQNSPGLEQNEAGAEVGSLKTSTMQTDYLFHFGDTTRIRKALEMPNRLTGYAFLIDSNGLVRWRGSGLAEKSEVDGLLRAADQLLKSR